LKALLGILITVAFQMLAISCTTWV